MLDESSDTAGSTEPSGTAPAGDTPAKPARRPRKTAKATAAKPPTDADGGAGPADGSASADAPAAATTPRKRTRKASSTRPEAQVETDAGASSQDGGAGSGGGVPTVVFQPPDETATKSRRPRKSATARAAEAGERGDGDEGSASGKDGTGGGRRAAAADRTDNSGTAERDGDTAAGGDAGDAGDGEGEGGDRPARRRRGRRGRGRGGAGAAGEQAADAEASTETAAGGGGEPTGATESADQAADDDSGEEGGEGSSSSRRRRRRRRRRTGEGGADGEGGDGAEEDVETVVHVREPRPAAPAKSAAKSAAKSTARSGGRSSGGGRGEPDEDGVRGVKGSTRLEAKRQRRREGRDSGRRRPPIITEAEFLARRESVDRVMVVRQGAERTQIAVLEDGVLVEHYVARKDQASMVGNVYLGKVQNVLPSMEAAFVDIGRGRNAVLYAGEVNFDASALEGKPPRIEQALKSGQSVLVQVTKDPIGHKGARLTSQVSLPGRYMVYVPDGRLSGISRKLPDTERSRLKGILKRLTPEDAGVIIRTAAEGASEQDLERDLNRLHAQWEDIDKKAQTASAPSLIYGEPDVVIRVIRDIFNEDFKELVVAGNDEWDTVDNYVRWVAPDLADRVRRWTDAEDVFAAYRVDEQLAKALDRKVWLPSGGYLVIDRTEAMIVVDVNTGKFTGKGGNLEETVTKNNLEAAEEIVRQLRLRDLGGIIVVDFIDMVLESNRELVLRRLTECLGRDRTRHQVAEVTSLGLVQMTRKRVGQGLLEAFSETCKECSGRGVILTLDPVASKRPPKPKAPPGVKGVAATPAAANAAEAGDAGTAAAEPAADAPATKPKRTRKRAAPKPEQAAADEPRTEEPPAEEPPAEEPPAEELPTEEPSTQATA